MKNKIVLIATIALSSLFAACAGSSDKAPDTAAAPGYNQVKSIDTTKVESIQIYGYCDDRGSDDYNFRLSNNRANTIQNLIVATGFNQSKIVILEGKGRVVVKPDTCR